MIKRRKLVVLLGAGALTAPFACFAQQPGKVWRVGVLVPGSRPASLDHAFSGAFPPRMRELGYVEGKNLIIEWRFADGNWERLPGLAAELLQLKVDVILAQGNQAVSAAQKATTTIPIVMGNANDPVGMGFVDSLARPGRNITGLSTMSVDLSPKYLELLLGMAPKSSRVAVLADPANPVQFVVLKNIQAAAQKVGVTILAVEARSLKEIESAFLVMIKGKAQAFIFASTPLFGQHRHRIAELAIKNRLPLISSFREYVEAGGLMSYGPNPSDNWRRAATYVDKILKGAKPADLPVEQPMTFELFINGKTAKALGLTIPPSILVRADRVIE